jgi:hypothetical protein
MLGLAVVIVAGCGTACRCRRPAAASPASAPERVAIDGHEYTLTASAWRDFQPIAPPDGQPLVVVLKMSAADKTPVPALLVDNVWVLKGREQWSTKPERAIPEQAVSHLETSVRGGPKWGPGIKVDVVVRLKRGEQTWLVRAAGVDIKRTD